LFTNVPVDGALKAIKRVINTLDEASLPLPKAQYLDLVALCMTFGCFSFNGKEYVQHSGLAMGSPLSPVAACLYMEVLEDEQFKQIMGSGSIWMRYVDDVLVVIPKDTDLDEKLTMLNAVNENVQFTIETERNDTIPFLDTCIVKAENRLKFKVYRKPTNKEDYVHFYSAHSDRVKSGIIIGFFLRALRICDEEYLADEIEHIYQAFSKLKYPKGLLIQLRKKAEQIRNRKRQATDKKNAKPTRWISIPYSKPAQIIARTLETTGLKVSMNAGGKIGDLVRKNANRDCSSEMSVVYEVPCSGCPKTYVGETGRGVEKRLKEHKSDVKYHRTSNAIVLHIDKCKHLPKWSETKILEKNIKKQTRKILEAAHIMSRDTFNTRLGCITWATPAVNLAVRQS